MLKVENMLESGQTYYFGTYYFRCLQSRSAYEKTSVLSCIDRFTVVFTVIKYINGMGAVIYMNNSTQTCLEKRVAHCARHLYLRTVLSGTTFCLVRSLALEWLA